MDHPKPSPASYWLFGVTLALFLALLALPSTHWITAQQSKMMLVAPGEYALLMKDLGIKEMPYPGDPEATERARKEAVDHSAGDYEIQLAHAIATYPPPALSAGNPPIPGYVQSAARLAPLRALVPRFPEHRAALSAHILRYACSYLGIHRDEEVETYNSGKPYKSDPKFQRTPPSDEYLAAYDQDAAEGERLEPDNAFFPLMRSIGHFTAHRDAEGIAALLRAGQKPRMNDYTGEEGAATWKLYETALGKQSATVRACVYSAILLPHYATIRSAARLAVYKAAKAEEAGNLAEGLAIRHAMMHCAHLMRTDSQSSIGPLVGIACAAIMTSRPGGAPPLTDSLTTDQRVQQRQEAYYAYLHKIGQGAEADWAKAELEAGPKTKTLITEGMKLSPLGGEQMNGLFDQWTLDMILLTNALELLVMGGAMLLLARLRKDTGNAPMTVALGLCTVFVMLAFMAHWSEVFTSLRTVFMNLNSDESIPSDPFLFSLPVVKAKVMALSLVGPFLAMVILGFLRSVRQKEAGPIVASGLRTGGIAVALGLLAVYTVSLSVTLQKEAKVNTALDRILQNETRYLAELQGKAWPP